MGIVGVVLFPGLGTKGKRKLWSSTYHTCLVTKSQHRSQPCPALWILTNTQYTAMSNCKNSDWVDWYWAKTGCRDPSFASELPCDCGQPISPLHASASSPPLPSLVWSHWHGSCCCYKHTLSLCLWNISPRLSLKLLLCKC